MSRFLRTVLAALLVASQATGLALAAPPRPLGNILFAEHAKLGSVAAAAGATVFAGDRINTDGGGSVRIRIGTGQVYLLANSAIALEEYPGGVSAALARGTVGFASGDESLVVVRASEVLIRPKNPQQLTHAQVALVGPKELLVSSYRGALEVVVGTEVHAVPEATTYRVLLETEPQDPLGAGAAGIGRARVAMIFVGVAIAAAVTTFVVLQNLSPKRP